MVERIIELNMLQPEQSLLAKLPLETETCLVLT